MLEILGYAGSVLVAVSLMMSNVWRLRWINLLGASLFMVYGIVVRAYPVALVNAVIVAVDAYFLGLLAGKKDYFSLMPVASADESLLKGFIDYYQADILRFFPGFTLRNLMPVGLFVCEPLDRERLAIRLDYVIPEYRDLRNARYLYSTQAGIFKEQGFRELLVQTGSREFETYIRGLGFAVVPGEGGSYTKKL